MGGVQGATMADKADMTTSMSPMDPNSPQFQSMLEAARSKGEAQLSIKQDTSTVSEPEKDEKKASSAKGEETKGIPAKDTQDEDEVDVTKLQNQLRGLKAELTRVRDQRSHSTNEATELRDRIAKLEGRLEERKTSSGPSLESVSDDRLVDLEVAYADELADARALAHQATAQDDKAGLAEASKRITSARDILKQLKVENRRREEVRVASRQGAVDESKSLQGELEDLYTEMFKAIPELADANSEIRKAGQKEYEKLPTLMKKLGPLGEMIATAAAIAKNPAMSGKKQTEKVLENIEKAADKAFSRGAAPQAGSVPFHVNVNSREGVNQFEEMVRKVKLG
jgi:chromosome segregation ATPase